MKVKLISAKIYNNLIYVFVAVFILSILSYKWFWKDKIAVSPTYGQIQSEANEKDSCRSESQLENLILKKGDVEAYNELSLMYLNENRFTFLPWALVMANKYQYNQAYFDVYSCLFDINCQSCNDDQLNNWSLDNLDNETQCFAISYLRKASIKNHRQAKDVIEIYKKQGKYSKCLQH